MDQAAEQPLKTGTKEPPLSESEKNAIIAGVLLSMLLAALDQAIVAPAMPTIAKALGDAQYLPWIVTAYLLTATAMAPLYGKISDVRGRRVTLYAAILIFLVGSLVSATAQSMFMLIVGRAVQGLGGGGLFALTQTVIGDLVPPRERARYAAWISGTWAVASVAGPLLGGYFAQHLHWSLIFWINLPLGAVAMVIINHPLKKLSIPNRQHGIDGWGALLLIAATSLLLLALNWGGSTYPWGSPEILGLLASSALVWCGFAARLLTAREPLVTVDILRNNVILAGTVAMFFAQAVNVGLAVYLPIYLQSSLRLSASESGTALLGLLLGTVAGAMTSGKIIPRFTHYKRIAVFGSLLTIASLAILGHLAHAASLALVEVLTTLAGIGTGAIFPVMTVSVQNAVTRANLGVATGVLTFLRSLGGALGVALLGTVAFSYGLPLSSGAASAPAEPHSAAPFAMVFLTSAALTVITFALVLAMPEKPLRSGFDEDAPVIAE